MSIGISNRQARRLVLHLQGLTPEWSARPSGDELYDMIVQLGFVQVDSIRWVERAHHMILFARNQHYRPHHLHELIEQERTLFENYTHDASIIPAEFFRFWKHKFDRNRERLRLRMIKWQGSGFLDHCESLIELIRRDGPVRSRDLERPQGGQSLEMWQWHDGKAALEFLWRTGELAITARDGFQKVYDLSHRVIPRRHHASTCSHDAFVDWACRGAIERLGFGSAGDIARYWNLVKPQECRRWISGRGRRLLKEVTVETADGSPARRLVARRDIAAKIDALPKPTTRVRVMSPFDPVVRDRDRLGWLFDLDYRIEIYVPAAKRKFGYYVFPLLQGDQFFGRIDMRAQRSNDCLNVRRVWLESGWKWSDARRARLRAELNRQAKLAGVSRVDCPLSVFAA
jgi:uncharacterized protein YcaQ